MRRGLCAQTRPVDYVRGGRWGHQRPREPPTAYPLRGCSTPRCPLCGRDSSHAQTTPGHPMPPKSQPRPRAQQRPGDCGARTHGGRSAHLEQPGRAVEGGVVPLTPGSRPRPTATPICAVARQGTPSAYPAAQVRHRRPGSPSAPADTAFGYVQTPGNSSSGGGCCGARERSIYLSGRGEVRRRERGSHYRIGGKLRRSAAGERAQRGRKLRR